VAGCCGFGNEHSSSSRTASDIQVRKTSDLLLSSVSDIQPSNNSDMQLSNVSDIQPSNVSDMQLNNAGDTQLSNVCDMQDVRETVPVFKICMLHSL